MLIISAVHDYRMKRRGSIQAIADALRDAGADVTFLSVRFSFLSKYKHDPRQSLAAKCNAIERHHGVDCFLWRTLFHPFGTRNAWINAVLRPLFGVYARWPSRRVDDLIRRATVIVIESGLGVVLAQRIKRANPTAVLIYRASDRLSTIDQHPFVGRALVRNQKLFTHFGLLGPGMASDFIWAYPKAFLVPPGVDRDFMENKAGSPYQGGINAISLGPMLFDASFFDQAGPSFPNVSFHIFGVMNPPNEAPPNVFYHAEIPHADTAAYVHYATFGIAPYRNGQNIGYLADTSSKLLQYASFGLPAVCPSSVVGNHANRFGYEPGDAASIEAAISLALAAPRLKGVPRKGWQDIAARLIAPEAFDDTKLQPPPQGLGSATEIVPVSLSLIVATRGRREPLRQLLSSLKQQTSPAFEVIIVDQNPPGYLDEVVTPFSPDLPIRTVRSEQGLSLARNRGLAISRGSVVAFPDDDCWYPPTLVEDVLRFFSVYPDIDIMLGQTTDATGRASLSPARTSGGEVTPNNIWFSGNSNTLFVRGILARSLRFDEELGVGARSPYQSGEETDFILQALSRGSQAVYCPNVVIYHEQVDEKIGRTQVLRAWKYAAGFGRLMRTRYGVAYAGYRICRTFAGAFIELLSGRPSRAIYKFVWGVGTVRGWLV